MLSLPCLKQNTKTIATGMETKEADSIRIYRTFFPHYRIEINNISFYILIKNGKGYGWEEASFSFWEMNIRLLLGVLKTVVIMQLVSRVLAQQTLRKEHS